MGEDISYVATNYVNVQNFETAESNGRFVLDSRSPQHLHFREEDLLRSLQRNHMYSEEMDKGSSQYVPSIGNIKQHRVNRKKKNCKTCSMSKAKRMFTLSRQTELQEYYKEYTQIWLNLYLGPTLVSKMWKKLDTFEIFKRYHIYATAMHDKPMAILVMGNRAKYLNSQFSSYMETFGVHHWTTIPHHLEQNRLSERMSQMLFTM
eukprot:Ihof_evm2s7 gene=Ihof_evmTU2s7